MTDALIALGANLAPTEPARIAVLARALDLLCGKGSPWRLSGQARWWRTPAWPAGSGPDFVNSAARLVGEEAPEALLARLHGVEDCLGRVRGARWGPRQCDLDLLAVGDLVLPDPATLCRWMARDPEAEPEPPGQLVLPHPRMAERAFVLAPLADIAPDWRHPLTGLSVSEMLAALPARLRAEAVPIGAASA